MDRDLQSIQEVRDLIARARSAQRELAEFPQEKLDAICAAIAQACAAVNAALGEAIHAVQSSPYFLEITHPAATKSRAAAILAQRLGIDHEEIIAFGDSMNDLDLLQFAGMGVAVANAAPQVLAAADYITDTNENDGVAKALAELL